MVVSNWTPSRNLATVWLSCNLWVTPRVLE
jgi:hypothetical protein